MIKFLKPTKFKILAMVLIWVSVWCAGQLEDIIEDPIVQKVSPEMRAIAEQLRQQIDVSEVNEKVSHLKVGTSLFLVESFSRALMFYICSCVIIGIAEGKRAPNKSSQEE